MPPIRILIVEDENIVAMDLGKRLKRLGYEVPATASSGEQAIQSAGEHRPDLVLMDIVLKGEMDGIQAAEEIHARYDIPVVFLTAYADDKTLQRAKLTGPLGYIVKPFKEGELHAVIQAGLYRHDVERRLEESEERYRTLFDNVNDAIFILDLNGRFLDVNRTACERLGYSREELLQMGARDIDTHKFAALVDERFEAFKKHGQHYFETAHVRRDGAIIPIELSVRRIDYRDQSAVLSIARDITERQRAQAALQKAKDELEIKVVERTAELREANARLQNLSARLQHYHAVSPTIMYALKVADDTLLPIWVS